MLFLCFAMTVGVARPSRGGPLHLLGSTVRMLVANKAGGWTVSMLGGAGGALAGAWIARASEFHADPASPGFASSLLGAFVVVAMYHAAAAMRRRAS
jgi:uncharacterized membrane protein YeaQ/YmgE (transglycosylase-associated protein family)